MEARVIDLTALLEAAVLLLGVYKLRLILAHEGLWNLDAGNRRIIIIAWMYIVVLFVLWLYGAGVRLVVLMPAMVCWLSKQQGRI